MNIYSFCCDACLGGWVVKKFLDEYLLNLLRRFLAGKARACSHSTLSFPPRVAQKYSSFISRISYLSALALKFNKNPTPSGVTQRHS